MLTHTRVHVCVVVGDDRVLACPCSRVVELPCEFYTHKVRHWHCPPARGASQPRLARPIYRSYLLAYSQYSRASPLDLSCPAKLSVRCPVCPQACVCWGRRCPCAGGWWCSRTAARTPASPCAALSASASCAGSCCSSEATEPLSPGWMSASADTSGSGSGSGSGTTTPRPTRGWTSLRARLRPC